MARKRKKAAGKQEFDSSRWTHAIFAAFAFMAAWMFVHLIEDVWAWTWSEWPQAIPRPIDLWAKGAGIIIGIALVVWGWTREKYFKFVSEVVVEVSQIIWPTRAETRAATIVVVVITLICSGILALMDLFWSRVTDWLYAL